MLGGEDADLASGSFPMPGLPPDNSRALSELVAATPLLSRKPTWEATFAALGGQAAEPLAHPPLEIFGGTAMAAAVGSESLARLRCSFCWRCCCLSSIGLRRRLPFLPLPPVPAGDDLAAVFCACCPFLLLSFDRSAAASRGPAPFSVALLSGAGGRCCTACSASSPPYTIVVDVTAKTLGRQRWAYTSPRTERMPDMLRYPAAIRLRCEKACSRVSPGARFACSLCRRASFERNARTNSETIHQMNRKFENRGSACWRRNYIHPIGNIIRYHGCGPLLHLRSPACTPRISAWKSVISLFQGNHRRLL